MTPLADLIKAVQTKLGLVADGDARGRTWLAVANALEAPASAELGDTIKSVQRKLELRADGDPREKTWTAIAKALDVEIPAPTSDLRPLTSSTLPKAAIDLILESEGVDQPSKWPGEQSGITIGFGYDLGYEGSFISDWKGILKDGEIHALVSALGVTGQRAAAMAPGFRGIKITREQALKVFYKHTLPEEEAKTLKAFPGLEQMPPAVRGALVSLVFNRGTLVDDSDRRREMRVIRDLILRQSTKAAIPQNDCLREIARQFRSMKRLWVGKGVDGLITRREAEADLIESAIT